MNNTVPTLRSCCTAALWFAKKNTKEQSYYSTGEQLHYCIEERLHYCTKEQCIREQSLEQKNCAASPRKLVQRKQCITVVLHSGTAAMNNSCIVAMRTSHIAALRNSCIVNMKEELRCCTGECHMGTLRNNCTVAPKKLLKLSTRHIFLLLRRETAALLHI